MKEEIALIDSNILVYAFDTFDKNKHEKSKSILERYWNEDKNLAVSLQNLSEFYVTTTKKINLPLEKSVSKSVIKRFLEFKNCIKLVPKETTIIKAIELTEEYGVDYWDALIAAVMIENNISTIYTENVKDFSKVKELKVINPFSKV